MQQQIHKLLKTMIGKNRNIVPSVHDDKKHLNSNYFMRNTDVHFLWDFP